MKGVPPSEGPPSRNLASTRTQQRRCVEWKHLSPRLEIMVNGFPIDIGQTLTKSEIHALVGGSGQHAMTSCLNQTAFLIFHDPIKGRKFGYDVWEGPQIDGSFHYTGQGVRGHQRLRGPNRSLLNAAEEGRPIHFFRRPPIGAKRTKSNPYTYFGLVSLENPQYEVRQAPDETGAIRNVFVFHLMPLGHGVSSIDESEVPGSSPSCVFSSWSPTSADVARAGPSPVQPAQASLEENKLQKRFWNFMRSIGEEPERVSITLESLQGSLYPDFILRSRGLVVEAKPSTSRIHVRLAIGQVLDYANLLALSGNQLKPGVLLPQRPQKDLCNLLHSLGIALIFETSEGEFEFV